MGGIANHFPAKNALYCRILHILANLRRSASGARTQTPISAWFASVPIVPILRNDHCYDADESDHLLNRQSSAAIAESHGTRH